jgi:hypothetical protein
MKRLVYVLITVLLFLLSAVGAADIILRLDLASDVATMAGIASICYQLPNDRACAAPKANPLTKSAEEIQREVEELERDFAREVRRFIDLAVARGHSVEEAKAMARDVVARAVRQTFKVVSPNEP